MEHLSGQSTIWPSTTRFVQCVQIKNLSSISNTQYGSERTTLPGNHNIQRCPRSAASYNPHTSPFHLLLWLSLLGMIMWLSNCRLKRNVLSSLAFNFLVIVAKRLRDDSQRFFKNAFRYACFPLLLWLRLASRFTSPTGPSVGRSAAARYCVFSANTLVISSCHASQ